MATSIDLDRAKPLGRINNGSGFDVYKKTRGKNRMNPVSTIFAKTYPFGLKNVDTDVIILAASLILEKVLGRLIGKIDKSIQF